jgi:hypothetical protein
MKYVACRGKCKLRTKFWLGSLKEKDYSIDQGVDERIILKLIFKESSDRLCDGYLWCMTEV